MLSGATRPAHATGAETRVATSVGIGSAGCIDVARVPVHFDKPTDFRFCRVSTLAEYLNKYTASYSWRNDAECDDMEGCLQEEDFNPFRVLPPTLCVKTMKQTNPRPGKSNVITVSLRAQFDIPTGSKFTVSGIGDPSCDNSELK